MSRHVYGVLANVLLRSPVGRRLAVPLLGALAIAILPAFSVGPSHVQLVTIPAANGPWLDRLNSWRASTGLPILTEVPAWSQGDYNHALYMVKNDDVNHYETPGTPYYTPEGDAAARNSNIYVSSSTSTTDVQAIDFWMQAPFHAMGLMDPRLTQTGFGSYREVKSGWQLGAAVDTLRGNSFTGGQYPVYYPGNGTTEPLTSYGGGEFPDPLAACPGYSAPTGLPVFIQVGGNVSTTAGPSHSFTGNGVSLNHCVFDSSNTAFNSYLVARGAVVLVPQQPLQSGVKYVVSLTVNSVPYTWSFTVGPFVPSVSVSPSAGPANGGTSVTITGTGFNNGTTGVKFGAMPAASFSVVNDTTITAVSPAHAGGPVDVTVTTAAGTSSVSTTDRFTFTCTTASLAPPSGSFAAGSTVTFTASSTGCASPQYAFWVLDPSGTWTLKQGFGGPTFNWNTAGLTPGSYTIHAWVNAAGNGYDAIGSSTVTLALSVCSAAGLMPANPTQAAGTTVNYIASSSGCPSPRYAFWVQYPGGAWYFVRDFGGPTFAWSTAGLAAGTYTVHVWVNAAGNSYDSVGSSTVTLTPSACASAALSPPNPTQAAGTTVGFTASSSGCASPRYAFWVQYPGGAWYFVRDFGGPTFNWSTAGLAPGTYTVHVWVNSTGNGYDSVGSSTVTLTGCTAASLAPPTVTQAAASTINFTASSATCAGPRYEFWIQYPDTTWHWIRDFGGPTFAYSTLGLGPGTYTVHVWVNTQGSGYDSVGSSTVTLT